MNWNVGCIVRKRAEVCAEKSAIIFEDDIVTYRDLNRRTNRCAHFLQRANLGRGDRLSVLLNNSVEFLEIYFACAKLGIIFVPLNWRLTGPELAFQLNDSGAEMLLFHDLFAETVDGLRGDVAVPDDHFVWLGSHGSELERPGWAGNYAASVSGESEEEPTLKVAVELSDPLAIVYTSGTTGNPKGAILSHEQTFFKNLQNACYTGSYPDAVVVSQLPLFHSGGLFIVATPSIAAGTTIILRSGFDPVQFAKDIELYRGTLVFTLTTMWKMVVATGVLDTVDVSSVQSVVGGGERTPLSLIEELHKRGLTMQQGFGQTENSAMTLLPKEDVFRKLGSVGKAGFCTDLWIEDGEGNRLSPGEVGELMASGPTVMSGYWNRPEETARTIVNGALHTGDLGYIDEEGYVYIMDRLKDMYRSGGENVYPAEVEKLLLDHPAIGQAAIIGVPDDNWGETGLAFVVKKTDTKLTIEEIHQYLEGKVSKFKFPSQVEFVAELPMTSTMKVRKAELKRQYADRQRGR